MCEYLMIKNIEIKEIISVKKSKRYMKVYKFSLKLN